MENRAMMFLLLGLIAGALAFAGIGWVWTFMSLAVFVVMLLSGAMLLVADERRRALNRKAFA